MFEKGDYILYGCNGVCQVEEIGHPAGISVLTPEKEYYTLRPVREGGVIYVPTDTQVYMRPIMSREEIEGLIEEIPQIENDLCTTGDKRMLAEQYRASLQSHSNRSIIRMLKSLHLKEEKLSEKGKHLGATDLNYKKQAEHLLYEEMAFVLDIPYESVERYIIDRIEHQNMPH